MDDLLTIFKLRFDRKIIQYLKTLPKYQSISSFNLNEIITLDSVTFQMSDQDCNVVYELDDLHDIYHGAIVEVIFQSESSAILEDTKNQKKRLLENETYPVSKYRKSENDSKSYNDINYGNDMNIKVEDEHEKILLAAINGPPKGYHILVKGLPFQATKNDLEKFFEELSISEGGIWIPSNPKGLKFGYAFVTFTTEDDQEKALKKNRNHLGSRYLVIEKIDTKFYQRMIQTCSKFNERISENHGTYILKCKGFSYQHTEDDVRQFFQESLSPYAIYIIYDEQCRNSGVVFIEFTNPKDERQCRDDFNGKDYCDRVISIYPASLFELRLSLATMTGYNIDLQSPEFIKDCTSLRMEGLPSGVNDEEIVGFFSGVNIIPKRINKNIAGKEAYIEFNDNYDCLLAYTRNKKQIRNRNILLFQVSNEELHEIHIRAMNSDELLSRDPFYNNNNNNYNNKENSSNNNICIVRMSGLPFTVCKDDIIEFFKGFKIDKKSIQLEKELNGSCNGFGTICFLNKFEAEKAIEIKNGQYIGHRFVKLRIL